MLLTLTLLGIILYILVIRSRNESYIKYEWNRDEGDRKCRKIPAIYSSKILSSSGCDALQQIN